jgi:hypothetical protein
MLLVPLVSSGRQLLDENPWRSSGALSRESMIRILGDFLATEKKVKRLGVGRVAQ